MFNMTRDINGYVAYGTPKESLKYSGVFATGIPQSITVPSNFGKWIAIFSISGGNSFWIAYNATAAVPAGAISLTSAEHNPTVKFLSAGDVISIVNEGTTSATIGLCLYPLSE